MASFLTLPKGLILAGVQTNLDSLDAVQCVDAATQGFRTSPGRLPPWCDVRKPISIYAVIAPLVLTNLPGTAIEFLCVPTWVTPPGTRTSAVVSMTWPVPAPWAASNFERILIDNGNGWTIDPMTIPSQSTIGARLQRSGANPNDTWTSTINVVTSLEVHFSLLPAYLAAFPTV